MQIARGRRRGVLLQRLPGTVRGIHDSRAVKSAVVLLCAPAVTAAIF
eukprot:COSAG04_NODE_14922_length_550_cov_0.390244_2_plen_46_part_01